MLLDSGAETNLIKKEFVNEREVTINAENSVYLTGIAPIDIKTLGSITINICGHSVEVQVAENIHLSADGILGAGFLAENGKLDFVKQCLEWKNYTIPFAKPESMIPARTKVIAKIHVNNDNEGTGYIPRLNLPKGLYAGDVLVRYKRNEAIISVINTNEKDSRITLPSVTVEDFVVQEEDVACDETNTLGNSGPSPDVTFDARNRTLGRPMNPSLSKACREICSLTTPPRSKELIKLRYDKIINSIEYMHLNLEERKEIERLIFENVDLFYIAGDKLGYTSAVTHTIKTINDEVVNSKQYRYPHAHRDEINRQIRNLLDSEIIKESSSPYNSPLWIVPKKSDNQGNKRWRLVIDYRELNSKTIGDAYPLPNIADILDQLGSAKYFTTLDLASGFHQIRMDPSDAHKTAFSTPYGHYEFTRMPFGLMNAPATFQRLMNVVLSGLQGIEMLVYLDDIVIYASSLTEHANKFKKLANRLRVVNLRLQPEKCKFLNREVCYLGHIITSDGVRPDPDKVKAVKLFPRPTNTKAIKQFLGLAGYYRRFISRFSSIAKPLTDLLKKNKIFVWDKPKEAAFIQLREELCKEPLLRYPDFSRKFILTTDASGYAIGGVLSQGEVGKDPPIAYTSRLLNSAERNYSTIERELLAVVYGVQHFRPYLYGREFYLVTDHKPLVWLGSVKDPASRLFRWKNLLEGYNYKIIYKSGKANGNADALSRNPVTVFPLSSSLNKRNPSSHDPHHDPGPSTRSAVESVEEKYEFPFENENLNDETPSSHPNPSDTSTETLFEPCDVPYEPFSQSSTLRIIELRDKLIMMNNTPVVFLNQDCEPADEGAKCLARYGRLPSFTDINMGRAKVMPMNQKRIIALFIQDDESEITLENTIKESFHSLLDVLLESRLRTISISKSDIKDIKWNAIRYHLCAILSHANVRILICNNLVQIPEEKDRHALIEENHSSAINGHKGITKTHQRLRSQYYWNGMRNDIVDFINGCRECQLKKLVRIKPRQPMALTDTPVLASIKSL